MSYKPKVLEVSAGGTGASTLTGVLSGNGTSAVTASAVTQYDVLVGGASNAISSVGPGSSGQVLQSAGNASNPAYSTATYPATGGTIGNVLTSDGINFISSPLPSSLNVATITLTSAQIKALHATPIQIIAAPGANKQICVLTPVWASFLYGGSNVFVAGSGQTVSPYYGTTTLVTGSALVPNAAVVSSSSLIINNTVALSASNPRTNLVNVAVNAYNPTVTEISGNAANDNSITISFLYFIASV